MIIDNTDISMIRGDSEALTVKIQDEAGVQILLVAGDIIKLTVKKTSKSIVNSFQKTVISFTEGVALIEIEPEDTNNLDFGVYYYDIELERADGSIKTIIPKSKFVIADEITVKEVVL